MYWVQDMLADKNLTVNHADRTTEGKTDKDHPDRGVYFYFCGTF